MEKNSRSWKFAGFHYSAGRGLERAGVKIALQPKVRGLLELLLQARGELASKEAIAAALWPTKAASDDSITRLARLLRRSLQDPNGAIVKTVYGAGLRLESRIEPASTISDAGASHELTRVVHEIAAGRTAQKLNRGREALRFVLAENPNNASGWSLLADTTAALAWRGELAPDMAAAEIGEATAQALALEPRHAGALAVSGWAAAILSNRLREGRRRLDEAVALDPTAWTPLYCRALLHAHTHDLTASLKDIDAGLALCPLERALLGRRAWTVLCLEGPDEADAQARRLLKLRPDVDTLWFALCVAAGLRGDTGGAIYSAERAAALMGRERLALSMLSWALAHAGRTAEARTIFQQISKPPFASAFLAPAMLAMGEADEARELLRAARAQNCPWRGMILYDPRLASLQLMG